MNKSYKYCIDPGHGGVDCGAIGYKRSHEADFNLEISKIISKLLIEQGQQVILTRSTDKWLSLAERADIANKSGCNAFISIHCNSAPDEAAHGIETWSYPGSIDGMKLSKLVQEEMIKTTGLTNRGCKEAKFGVLRMSNNTAILVETVFISNPTEEVLLTKTDFKEKIALAIVKGIFRYLGLEYKFSVELKVVNEVAAIVQKPIKIFKVDDLITAVAEESNYWIVDIQGQKAYVEKSKTIRR